MFVIGLRFYCESARTMFVNPTRTEVSKVEYVVTPAQHSLTVHVVDVQKKMTAVIKEEIRIFWNSSGLTFAGTVARFWG